MEKIDLRKDMINLYVTPSIERNELHGMLEARLETEVYIPVGESRVIEIDLKHGWHSLFAPSVHGMGYVIGRDDGPTEIDIEMYDGRTIPEQIEVRAGPVKITVHNKNDEQLPVGLIFLSDTDDIPSAPLLTIKPFLSGKAVLSNQTFRTLFSSDSVDAGTGLQLKSLTILFTDLLASTALYERVGDLRALELVRRHFSMLTEIIGRQRGAVVKTIGDAVMAVFEEPNAAMRAAAAMHAEISKPKGHGEELMLKIGLHTGPCIAIESNQQPDYFGRTVNIAARVQGEARGGEIVCTDQIWDTTGVPDIVKNCGLVATSGHAELKGIHGQTPVRRIVRPGA